MRHKIKIVLGFFSVFWMPFATQAGLDPNVYHPTNGKTRLMMAVSSSEKSPCNKDLIQKILSLKPDVNKLDNLNNKENALFVAIRTGCNVGVELLLKENINWQQVNYAGLNAFDLALSIGNFEAASLILSHATQSHIEVTGNGLVNVRVPSKKDTAAEEKRMEVEVKLGFSTGSISDEDITKLDAVLKGKYRFSERLEGAGSAELFYSKTGAEEASQKYIVTGKITNKSIFDSSYDASAEAKAEVNKDVSSLNIASLIERSWRFAANRALLDIGGGPGIRHSVSDENDKRTSATDMTVNLRQSLTFDLPRFSAFPSQVRFVESLSSDYGSKGYSNTFKVGAEFVLDNDWSLGAMYKLWLSKLQGKEVNDRQFSLDISKKW